MCNTERDIKKRDNEKERRGEKHRMKCERKGREEGEGRREEREILLAGRYYSANKKIIIY